MFDEYNKKLFVNLLQNFILGGSMIASVSYVATYLGPVEGAILWAYPFSLLPTLYFMKKSGKKNAYIGNFALIGTFAIILEIISTFALARFLKECKLVTNCLSFAILKSIGVWAIAGMIYYKFIYYFGLQNKFM
ncbi:hypothetical protein [uncultured Mediterranean phage]|nr:hypothetical protein [uncultured Mediterranean phage]